MITIQDRLHSSWSCQTTDRKAPFFTHLHRDYWLNSIFYERWQAGNQFGSFYFLLYCLLGILCSCHIPNQAEKPASHVCHVREYGLDNYVWNQLCLHDFVVAMSYKGTSRDTYVHPMSLRYQFCIRMVPKLFPSNDSSWNIIALNENGLK